MRISDWSSDVCSSDLQRHVADVHPADVATELVQRHGLLEARLDHQPADEIHAEGQPARGDQRDGSAGQQYGEREGEPAQPDEAEAGVIRDDLQQSHITSSTGRLARSQRDTISRVTVTAVNTD